MRPRRWMVPALLGLCMPSCNRHSAVQVASLGADLRAPAGGEVWGGVRTIRWQTDGQLDSVDIFLSTDGGLTYPVPLVQGLADSGRYAWDLGNVADGSRYRVRVIPISSGGRTGAAGDSAANFAVDQTLPISVVTRPTGGETWTGVQTITWNTTDLHPGTVRIETSDDSGSSWVLLDEVIDTGSYDWHTNSAGAGARFRVRVTPTDLADNVGTPGISPGDFTLDHTPRVVAPVVFEESNGGGGPDRVIVSFRTPVVTSPTLSPSDFLPAVAGDSFGTGAIATPGPAANQVTISLGPDAVLKSRQIHDGTTTANSPSAIDLNPSIGAGVIQNPDGGYGAEASAPVDLVPGLVDSGQRLGVARTFDVALGDLDADGDLDLVEANLGDVNRSWRNDGAGGFTNSGLALGQGSTRAVVLADMNGDGALDVVFGNDQGEADLVLQNNGAGSFATVQAFGNARTRALAVGDVDHNGALDVVVGDGSDANQVWLNQGGRLQAGATFGDLGTEALILVDIDKNGTLDLIEGVASEPDRVWTGDGKGTFTDSGQTLSAGTTVALAQADLDHDGDPDLVTGDDAGNHQLWRNDSGMFSAHDTLVGGPARGLTLADLDGNGSEDLLIGVGNGPDEVWLSDGTLSLRDSGLRIGQQKTSSLAVGDLDGDGDLDLIEGVEDAANRLYLGSLAGSWGGWSLNLHSAESSNFSLLGAALTADLNRDGELDCVTVDYSDGAGAVVYFGDGAGSLDAVAGRSGWLGSDLADVNRDGFDDFVVGWGAGGQDACVIFNNRDGIPDVCVPLQAGGAVQSAVSVDVNRDGALDVVGYSLRAPPSGQIWLGDGKGSFSPSTTIDFDMAPVRLPRMVASDLDRDGLEDLVISNDGVGQVWLNDGSGGFQQAGVNLAFGPNPTSLRVFDANGDSWPDLLDASAGRTQVWLNDADGSGSLRPGATLTGGNDAAGGDLNGDGAEDVLVVVLGVGVTAEINDGTGGFVTIPALIANFQAASYLQIVDLDHDGDRDMFLGETSEQITIYHSE